MDKIYSLGFGKRFTMGAWIKSHFLLAMMGWKRSKFIRGKESSKHFVKVKKGEKRKDYSDLWRES